MQKAFDKGALLSMINRLREQSEHCQADIPLTQHECPKCKDDLGYITIDEEGKEVYTLCDCRQKRSIDKAFKSSRITLEFQKKNFDSFDLADRPPIVRQAYNFARIYANKFEQIREERHNSICLLGRPGCGKTHLLMGVSNELLARGIKVLYFPWVEGFNELKDNLDMTEERIRKMQQVEVLFIDDMFKGREKPTAFQLEQMFAVINHRYMEKRPILVSSEWDIDKMCDFDEALGSRINEMCKDFRIILKGGREMNYRLREDTE